MGYQDELEKLWRENRNAHEPRHSILERPKGLRGKDFVRELIRLGALTGDPRFNDIVRALDQHRIIDRHMNFTRWDSPQILDQQRQCDELMAEIIALRVAMGKTVRRACAEAAAENGFPAASFGAAVKHFQKLHRSEKGKAAQRKYSKPK
jgi:hypothetical protein